MIPLPPAGSAAPAGPPAGPSRDLGVGTLEEGVARLERIGAEFLGGLPAAGVGLVVLLLFVGGGRLTQLSVRRYAARRRRHGSLVLALGRLAYGAALVLGVLVAAVIVFPNFTPTTMLTSLGLGSLVLGLAFKDVLQNYLAGILLLFAEPFRPGDQIVYGAFEGTVEDVQPRATFVRTYDGRRVIIPNADLFTGSVTVNTAHDTRRVEYDVGIGYSDDIGRAREIILEAVRSTGSAETHPLPEALVVDLAPSGVNIRVRWWIRPPLIRETFDARDRVLQAIKERLQSAGIDLPYPTTQVLFHDQTEATDGDRRAQREGWPAGSGPVPGPRFGALAPSPSKPAPPAPDDRADGARRNTGERSTGERAAG